MLRTGEADIARISRMAANDTLNAGLNVITKENAGVGSDLVLVIWGMGILLSIGWFKTGLLKRYSGHRVIEKDKGLGYIKEQKKKGRDEKWLL
jgi:hypothetical protein